MSSAGSQRHGQGTGLRLPWIRAASASTVALTDERVPDRRSGPTGLLPIGLGGFSLAAGGLLAVFLASVGPGVWESVTGRPVVAAASVGRFAASLAAVKRCLDVGTLASLGGWLAQMSLVVAATTALAVRSIGQERRNGQEGRCRSWGWLSGLFLATACAGQAPLGSLFSALVSDVTGIRLGPEGLGWWVLLSGLLLTIHGLRAVMSLIERAAAAFWLGSCLVAWALAAACRWLEPVDIQRYRPFGNVCWMAGGTLAAIAMLAAARSVLREPRGLASAGGRADDGVPSASAGPRTDDDPRVPPRQDPDSASLSARTEYIDGTRGDEDAEPPGRRLSKAERKRMRKLARMGRAA